MPLVIEVRLDADVPHGKNLGGLVMRGITACAKDSRLPFPADGKLDVRLVVDACMKPFKIPSSIRTVRELGVPSSSIEREPRRSLIVPSSTTVTPGEATR